MPWRWEWSIAGPRRLKASCRIRPRGTRERMVPTSARFILSTAWAPWRQRLVRHSSLHRAPAPAAQDGAAAVVADFPAVGLAAVAAERFRQPAKFGRGYRDDR